MVRVAMLFAFLAGVQLASAFVVSSPARSAPPAAQRRHGVAVAGLFDVFKESEESKAAKEAEWQAIQEKAKLRRDPEAFAKYEAEVAERRLKEMEAMEEEKAALQSKNDVVVGFAEKGAAGPQAAVTGLPDGWSSAVDASSGDTYYVSAVPSLRAPRAQSPHSTHLLRLPVGLHLMRASFSLRTVQQGEEHHAVGETNCLRLSLTGKSHECGGGHREMRFWPLCAVAGAVVVHV